MKFIKNKSQFAWVMYDWADSTFATTVMAGFFPLFFKNYWSHSADVNVSTAYLGLANSLASLLVALLAPILGSIADQGNKRKSFLLFFAYLGALMTGCLFMVEQGNWQLALFLFIMGTVGFASANIFYDSLLPDISKEENVDYISAKGYALGYLGGGLLFLINVLWYTSPSLFGFETEHQAKVQKISRNENGFQIFIDEKKFNFQTKTKFKALFRSQYNLQAENVENFINENINYVKIRLNNNDINWEFVESPISCNSNIKADFVKYDSGKFELYVKNISGIIKKNSFIQIDVKKDIIIKKYEKGVAFTENDLGKYSEIMVLETDYLTPAQEFLPIRLSFLSVALWWALFTLPLVFWIKEKKHATSVDRGHYIKKGFGQLIKTFHKVKYMKHIVTFLIAYWMYIDGVNTFIRMAVDYGMSIGLPTSSLIKALLITQFVGFPFALIFGKLGAKWNVKKTLFIGIFIYLGINIWAVFMKEAWQFYCMAVIIGFVQGGIQALSRSLYSRIIPRNQSAEYFGFLNMTGKFAAIFGPVMVGGFNLFARYLGFDSITSTRIGIGTISILFIGGAIFLKFVDVEKGREAIGKLEI